MRSLRDRTIDLLLQNDFFKGEVFGDSISSLLFEKRKMALLLDLEQERCYLYCSEKNVLKNCILALTEVLGTISSLEKEGLIYSISEKTTSDLYLFYEGKEAFHSTQIPDKYEIRDNAELFYPIKGETMIHDDDCSMNGIVLPDEMFKEIKRILCSMVFPTQDLVEYASHNYRNSDQVIAHRSLIVSWVAIGVTVLFSIISILISLWLRV